LVKPDVFSEKGKTTNGHGNHKMSEHRMVYGDLSATDFFAIILIYLISPTERCFWGGYCFGVVRLS